MFPLLFFDAEPRSIDESQTRKLYRVSNNSRLPADSWNSNACTARHMPKRFSRIIHCSETDEFRQAAKISRLSIDPQCFGFRVRPLIFYFDAACNSRSEQKRLSRRCFSSNRIYTSFEARERKKISLDRSEILWTTWEGDRFHGEPTNLRLGLSCLSPCFPLAAVGCASFKVHRISRGIEIFIYASGWEPHPWKFQDCARAPSNTVNQPLPRARHHGRRRAYVAHRVYDGYTSTGFACYFEILEYGYVNGFHGRFHGFADVATVDTDPY